MKTSREVCRMYQLMMKRFKESKDKIPFYDSLVSSKIIKLKYFLSHTIMRIFLQVLLPSIIKITSEHHIPKSFMLIAYMRAHNTYSNNYLIKG